MINFLLKVKNKVILLLKEDFWLKKNLAYETMLIERNKSILLPQ